MTLVADDCWSLCKFPIHNVQMTNDDLDQLID